MKFEKDWIQNIDSRRGDRIDFSAHGIFRFESDISTDLTAVLVFAFAARKSVDRSEETRVIGPRRSHRFTDLRKQVFLSVKSEAKKKKKKEKN